MVNPNDPFIAPNNLYYARWLDWFLGEKAPDTYCNRRIQEIRRDGLAGYKEAEIDLFLGQYARVVECNSSAFLGSDKDSARARAAARSKGASPPA